MKTIGLIHKEVEKELIEVTKLEDEKPKYIEVKKTVRKPPVKKK